MQLRDVARRIERHYGRPQDIEWAIDRGHAGADPAEPAGNRVVGTGGGAGRHGEGQSAASCDERVRRKTVSLTASDVAEILKVLEESSFDTLDLEMNGVKLQLRRGEAGVRAAPAPAAAAARRCRETRHQRATAPRHAPAIAVPVEAPPGTTGRAGAAARHLLPRAQAGRAAVRRSGQPRRSRTPSSASSR